MPLIRRIKRQYGLGMIEVLVAGLIFALGVLGLSTMQVKAKRTSYDALQRSLATSLARDMVARMRSNPTAKFYTQILGLLKRKNRAQT